MEAVRRNNARLDYSYQENHVKHRLRGRTKGINEDAHFRKKPNNAERAQKTERSKEQNIIRRNVNIPKGVVQKVRKLTSYFRIIRTAESKSTM